MIDSSVTSDPLSFMAEIYAPDYSSMMSDTHLIYHVDMYGDRAAYMHTPDGRKIKITETNRPADNYTYVDGFSLDDEFSSWGYAMAIVKNLYGQTKILRMDLHKGIFNEWLILTPQNVSPRPTSSLVYFNDKAYFAGAGVTPALVALFKLR